MDFTRVFLEGKTPSNEDLVCIYYKNRFLSVANESKELRLPTFQEWKRIYPPSPPLFYLGKNAGQAFFCLPSTEEIPITEPYSFKNLRELYRHLDEFTFRLLSFASHVAYWHLNTQYCGRCATPTKIDPREVAKECPNCHLRQYPRISPAVITAIIKGDEILLGRAPRFPEGMYSTLAGFVEADESLEECLHREVYEEVGIKIHNIRYFGSQPWPFPDSLMVGFIAEYLSGEIKIDPEELSDAQWFQRDKMPLIPPRLSIARKMIDWFLEQGQS